MELQKTKNYGQFSVLPGNRPIDWAHVNRLVGKIQKRNLLYLNPMLCNSKLGIIDGQHRLEAAKELNEDIYYIADDNLTRDDIAMLNSNKKNWTILDFINYWAQEEAPGFDLLVDFMIENPLIPPSTVLQLFSGNNQRDTSLLREGKIDTRNHGNAKRIGEILKEFNELFKFAYDRNFILAIMKCVNTPGYDHQMMMNKANAQPRSLVKCISTKQYLEMLDEIYNYQLSKNRVKLA